MQKVSQHEKPCFTAAASADNQDVFVSGIGWILGTVTHHEPLRLRKNDVVFKLGINIWGDVVMRAP